jgi:hypothetical protein
VVVGAEAASTSSTRPLFDISSSGSSINISGGSIELRQNSPLAPTGEYSVVAGAIFVCDGRGAQNQCCRGRLVFRIYSARPVGNLLLTGTNDPAVSAPQFVADGTQRCYDCRQRQRAV